MPGKYLLEQNVSWYMGDTQCASGLPSCALQEEMKIKTRQKILQGSRLTKAADSQDIECPDLVAFSIYALKLLYFLSMSCTELKWVENVKVVTNKKKKKLTKMKFMRCSINVDYSNGWNGVDIADQLHHSCQKGKWMQKWKWW
jgi:hypothetical protein